jgi:hypothetical protein
MTMEAGVTDTAVSTNSVKGTYYLACLFLASETPTSSPLLRRQRVHAQHDGNGGKLTLKLTPMIIRDAEIAP